MWMLIGIVFVIASTVLIIIGFGRRDNELFCIATIFFSVCGIAMIGSSYRQQYNEGYNQGATDYALGKCKVDTIEVKYNVTKTNDSKKRFNIKSN